MKDLAIDRLNELAERTKKKLELSWVKKNLIKLYFKSPAKVQYALAKYGVKTILTRKKEEIEELIRH